MEEKVVRKEISGRILTLTIDREERRNALNGDVLHALVSAVVAAKDDPQIGVIVLTGAGDRAFCAGADLAGIRGDTSKIDQHHARANIVQIFEALAHCGKPVVARVNGHALAGGFGLLCSTDMAIAADDAEFGMPEINSGLWPFIISAIVRTKLPENIALELMMTGRRMSAEEALRWGLVNRVVPRSDLDAATDELVQKLASFSSVPLKLGKDSWNTTRNMSRADAMRHLHAMLSICLDTEDVVEGISAFFEKRPPVWKHR